MCRQVTSGMPTLRAMEQVETTRQGIFVMPKDRITIFSTFMFYVADPQDTLAAVWSFQERGMLPSEHELLLMGACRVQDVNQESVCRPNHSRACFCGA
jgi:hypothetical protein